MNERTDAPSLDGEVPPASARGRLVRLVLVVVVVGGVGAWMALSSGGGAQEQATRGPKKKRVPAVEVASVERGTLVERAEYAGELDADAVDLAARVAGRLKSVEGRVGERVEAGATLAAVDDAELSHQIAEAKAQVRAARATGRRVKTEIDAAQRDLDRAEKLADRKIVSAQDLDAARTRVATLKMDRDAALAQRAQASARVELLEQRLADSTLVAPFAGVISQRMLDPGAYVQPGTPIVRIVSNGPLRVQFHVPEREVVAVQESGTVHVRTPATGERELSATITGVGGEVDRTRRTVLLEARVDDAPAAWLPGMSAEVVASVRTWRDAVVLPADSVVQRLDAEGAFVDGVFLVDGDTASFVPVRVMGRQDALVAVEGALTPGSRVIVRGHADLSDGSPVKVVDPGGRG